mmetsp:Transcript_2593/g.2701  ORF Transcript_2593/g.2701 Transcript_2593/m.2701 type:complete len:476 (-) Transcript_2593:244-1671(-)
MEEKRLQGDEDSRLVHEEQKEIVQPQVEVQDPGEENKTENTVVVNLGDLKGCDIPCDLDKLFDRPSTTDKVMAFINTDAGSSSLPKNVSFKDKTIHTEPKLDTEATNEPHTGDQTDIRILHSLMTQQSEDGSSNPRRISIGSHRDLKQHQHFYQSDNSELHIFKHNKQRMEYEETSINILVVGEVGVGKSTFIQEFLSLKFDCGHVAIRPNTYEIKSYKGTLSGEGLQVNVKMYDSPGYGKLIECNQWSQGLVSFLKGKFMRHNQKKRQQAMDLDDGNSPKVLRDSRIHLCLYFLNGPRIKDDDIFSIKKLQHYVNILPIIAKSDTLTVEEIRQLKQDIIIEAEKNALSFFDVTKCPGFDHFQQALSDGPLGFSPPFAIVSHTRQYSWGECQRNNPEHSEFEKLSNLLVPHFGLPCIKLTKEKYKRYIARIEREEDQQRELDQIKQTKQMRSKLVCALLMGGGVVAASLVKYFKR